MRPILFSPVFVNHRFPSGPEAMPDKVTAVPDDMMAVTGNSVTTPAGVMRPILPTAPVSTRAVSVNQRLPSGPAAMAAG